MIINRTASQKGTCTLHAAVLWSNIVQSLVGKSFLDKRNHLAFEELHLRRVNNRWYLRRIEGYLAEVLGHFGILSNTIKYPLIKIITQSFKHTTVSHHSRQHLWM